MARTTVAFPNDDFGKILKLVVALAAIGFIPNKYGKMAGVALAVSAFL